MMSAPSLVTPELIFYHPHSNFICTVHLKLLRVPAALTGSFSQIQRGSADISQSGGSRVRIKRSSILYMQPLQSIPIEGILDLYRSIER